MSAKVLYGLDRMRLLKLCNSPYSTVNDLTEACNQLRLKIEQVEADIEEEKLRRLNEEKADE